MSDEKPEKKKKGDDEKPITVSIAQHPRAKAGIRRARTLAGFGAFMLVLALNLLTDQDLFDALWRALVAGLIVNVIVWRCAIVVWKHIIVTELRAEEDRRAEVERERQERLEQPGHEVRAEVPDVGVQPADEVAVAHVERLPQGVALARAPGEVGEDLLDREHPCPLPAGDFGGGIGRPVVDDEHLVDERDPLHERAPDRGHRVPDRRLLVAGGQAHGHREAAARLGDGKLAREGRLGHSAERTTRRVIP